MIKSLQQLSIQMGEIIIHMMNQFIIQDIHPLFMKMQMVPPFMILFIVGAA